MATGIAGADDAENVGAGQEHGDRMAVVSATAALEYTREQRAAIKADPSRNALLLALAGSGKTAVAAWQVAYLLKYRHFEPRNVVALTYSVRAADSLRDRITRTVEDKLNGPVLGMAEMGVDTLHAWSAKVLRDHVRRYARNEIYNEATRRLFLSARFEKIGVGRIPRRRGKRTTLTAEPHDFSLFLDVCDRLREERVPADGRLGPEMLAAYRAYLRALDAAGAWDYPQILATLYEALTDTADADCLALQRWITDTVRLVVVDEAQDLGAGEWAILDRLHDMGARLWLIADGRQRIFSFRSADGSRLDRFMTEYDAVTYELTTNFRSSNGVVSVANALLRAFLWPRTGASREGQRRRA